MKIFVLFSAFLWISTAVGGFYYLSRYQTTSAETNVSYPAIFPEESRIKLDSERPTLIFFAHPKCPCTRASLNELSRLMTDANGKVRVYIVFIKPADESDDWAQTYLRTKAEAIPNAEVLIDEGEREMKIFSAETSGLTLLYDRFGNLRFNGGITASRGHEGDNAGRLAVFDIVTAETDRNAETPVFGCLLRNKDCPMN